MDSRAQAAARRLFGDGLSIGVAVSHLEKNLSLIGEPHRLSVVLSLIRKIDQRSDTEKPLLGDFLRANFKFTRTSDLALKALPIRRIQTRTVGGAVGNHQAPRGQPRRPNLTEELGRCRNGSESF